MLTIKTTGLLYRFLKFNGATQYIGSGQATLCGTFWLTLWHLVKDIGIAAALAFVSVFPAMLVAEQLGWIAPNVIIWSMPWWTVPTLVISGAALWAVFFGAFIGILWVLAHLWEKSKKWRDSRKFAAALKEELARDEDLTWSNIWQKAKIAKKDKLCPLVKVEYVE